MTEKRLYSDDAIIGGGYYEVYKGECMLSESTKCVESIQQLLKVMWND